MVIAQTTLAESHRYSGVARTLHWAMFALVAAQFVVAWTMPPIEWGTEPEFLINLHLSLGVLLMLLVIVRLAWRFTHAVPPPVPGLPAWQRWAATLMHFALYALLLILPLTGWAAAAARGWPVTLFGLFRLPGLVPAEAQVGFKAGDMHADLISWAFLALVALHVVAGLYHHFVKRDDVLRRMLPVRR